METEIVELLTPEMPRKRRRRKNAHKPWSKVDDRYLRKHYEGSTYKTLAAHLCRTPGAIAQRASQLGITN